MNETPPPQMNLPQKIICVLVFLMAAWLGFLAMYSAHGAEYDAEIGATYSIFDQHIQTVPGWQVKAYRNNVYLWGSYESAGFKKLGQNLTDLDMYGAGLGVQYRQDKIGAFLEFGYFRPEINTRPTIQNEVVIQQLRNDFGTNSPDFNHTRYALSNGYGARLGVKFDVSAHLTATGAYRWLNLDESLDAWEGGPARPIVGQGPDCGCLWQERDTISASAFEFGLFYAF